MQFSDATSQVSVSNCPILTTIILGLGIVDDNIGLRVSSCKELTDVYSPILTPLKKITYGFSDDCQIEYATLHVPLESVEAYKATQPWSKFGTIVALQEGDPRYMPLPPYALLSNDNTTLTFYYDKNNIPADAMKIRPFSSEYSRGWHSNCSSITTVVFDKSLAAYTGLTSTAYWFYGCSNLTTITGINNLKTDNVTDMGCMFRGCSSLTSLDVSGFKTDNVTDMGCMFLGCSSLTSFDLSSFNTANVTRMDEMFYNCNALTSLNLNSFNTANVTRMDEMFYWCSGLTSLDLRSFNTANVTNMHDMFYYCKSLKAIYASNGWNTDKVDTSAWGTYRMFEMCTNLIGGAGTTFSSADYTYAHIDGGPDNPGYFTQKGLVPIDNADFSNDINQNTNLDGNVVGDILYNISAGHGSYDATERCIVVTKPTDDAAIHGTDIFGSDFREGFTGIVFKLPAGKGKVKVQAETTGNMVLKVKIGNDDSIEAQLESKQQVLFPYNVGENTLVYVYGGTAAALRGMRIANNAGSVKLYGVEIEQGVKGDLNGDGVVDVGDIMAVINVMAGGVPGGAATGSNADVNGDGQVDVGDIMAIINMMAQH